MKSLPLPIARARRDFADVIDAVRRGQRVRLTRHGRPVAWIIGEEDHRRLDDELEEVRTADARKR